ncbi:MAG TPA: CinA family protein [Candidatus Acetothermia bacterium]|nr:CinA family protein [Candidatus Acetothermia bacterium]
MMKEDPAARLGEELKRRGWTIAVAESCTAGGLGKRITDVPGASSYFLGGIIAYHNSVKERFLAVPSSTVSRFGAVSEETAKAMASGCREAFEGDIAIAITGIAGPGGGTADKPVGLVYISIAGEGGVACERFRFDGDRSAVRRSAVEAALNMALLHLERTCP